MNNIKSHSSMNLKQQTQPKSMSMTIVLAIFLSLWAINAQCAELSIIYSNDNHGEIEPCG